MWTFVSRCTFGGVPHGQQTSELSLVLETQAWVYVEKLPCTCRETLPLSDRELRRVGENGFPKDGSPWPHLRVPLLGAACFRNPDPKARAFILSASVKSG